VSTSECAARVKPVERSRTRQQKGQSKRKETTKGKGGYQWRHKHKTPEPYTCAADIDVTRNPPRTMRSTRGQLACHVARLGPRRQLLVDI